MRRKDRELTDILEIESIIMEADSCRLALVDDGLPYIVAMNHGYEASDGENPARLYFHSAREGRKVDLARNYPEACFQLDIEHELVSDGARACDMGMKFASVVGFGKLSIVEDEAEIKLGLNSIMRHYSGRAGWEFDEQILKQTLVLKLEIRKLSAKRKK